MAAATEVGAGRQHRLDRPARPRARSRRAPLAEPDSAAEATATVDPAIIAARRTAASGTPPAAASPSWTSESRAPWRTSPVTSPRSQRCSSAVARPNRVGGRLGPGRLRAGARQPGDALERLVHLAHGQRTTPRRAPAAPASSASPGRYAAGGASRRGRRSRSRPRRPRGPAARPGPRPWPCATGSNPPRWTSRRPRRGAWPQSTRPHRQPGSPCSSNPDPSWSWSCSPPRCCTPGGTRSRTRPRTGWSASP